MKISVLDALLVAPVWMALVLAHALWGDRRSAAELRAILEGIRNGS